LDAVLRLLTAGYGNMTPITAPQHFDRFWRERGSPPGAKVRWPGRAGTDLILLAKKHGLFELAIVHPNFAVLGASLNSRTSGKQW